jgi:hypothetical protein
MMIQSDYEDKPGDIYVMRINFEFYSYTRQTIDVSGCTGDILLMIDPVLVEDAEWRLAVLMTATGELVSCGYNAESFKCASWTRVFKYSNEGL